MNRHRTKICAHRYQGHICELGPGHLGAHHGQGRHWMIDVKPAARRRARIRAGRQARLPL
jgi:hypothetical protein